MRGLLVGRMQPFHNGHLAVIKEILEKEKEVIIVIGSSQESHTNENPFTAGERILMVRNSLLGERIPAEKFYVIPLPDINNNDLWVAHVRAAVPPFDTVYTSNPLVTRLFKEAGYKVEKTKMRDRERLAGTSIRKKIASGGEWESLVPPAVAKIIQKTRGVERIKDLRESDKVF